jgi:hypothetical protein
MLQWIRNSAIDRQKWDNCIEKCPWGNIYARSHYLDFLTKNNWEALVWGEYEIIMPVPVRVKYGITYTYRPNFCQQLGIFSQNGQISSGLTEEFFKLLFTRFSHIHYPLNFNNQPIPFSGLQFKLRTNFILDLNRPYNDIQKSYSGDLRRNLTKAEKSGIKIVENQETEPIIKLFKKAWNDLYYISDDDYTQFELLVNWAKSNGLSKNYGVYKENILLAACVTFQYKNRIYYPFSAISNEGRQLGATAFMIDQIIQKNQEEALLLDFEGSDLENVKYFYQKFSPTIEPYYQIEKLFKPLKIINSLLKRRS